MIPFCYNDPIGNDLIYWPQKDVNKAYFTVLSFIFMVTLKSYNRMGGNQVLAHKLCRVSLQCERNHFIFTKQPRQASRSSCAAEPFVPVQVAPKNQVNLVLVRA